MNEVLKTVDGEIVDPKIPRYEHEINSIYVTSTNTNPKEKLGYGEWELIKKEFQEKYDALADNFDKYLTVGANTTCTGIRFRYSGTTVHLVLSFDYKGSIGENTITLATLNFENLGFTNTGYAHNIPASADTGDAVVLVGLSGAGALTTRDVISRAGSSSINNPSISTDFVLVLTKDLMKDEYCDKFFWKRIS